MSMTRRDFDALANLLSTRLERENIYAENAARNHGTDSNTARNFRASAGGVQLVTADLIEYLRDTYPRFNAEKFAKHSGIAHLLDVHPEWRTRK